MSGRRTSEAESARIRAVVDRYMAQCDGLRAHCERCLASGRWGGSVVLMVVDAAFMSIGLNYFTSVVPAVARYEQQMHASAVPCNLSELSHVVYENAAPLWKNRRSWQMARDTATALLPYGEGDTAALRTWAAAAPLATWREDPIGAVSGVGINTYQYFRMMGGIDTSMPDKIVRRVIAAIVAEAHAGLPTAGDLELVDTIDRIAQMTGHRPIELCWMTWMVQSEGKTMRMDKYRELLQRI
jgi:hypothetical protein